VVVHPVSERAAHHDLLPIGLHFLQFHARVALELAPRARQGHPELGEDVVRWRIPEVGRGADPHRHQLRRQAPADAP